MKHFQAFSSTETLVIPEVQVIQKPTDQVIPLRGYKYVVGIRREGELVGWAMTNPSINGSSL